MPRGKRRNNFVPEHNETLSLETPKVQEKLLEDLVENTTSTSLVEPQKDKETKETKENKENKEIDFKIGDCVNINNDVKFDILGKRIYNGLKNYRYRILTIRVDGMLVVECLTHCFTLNTNDVHKI